MTRVSQAAGWLGGSRSALAHGNVVAFQLAVKRGPADAEHLSGQRLVAVDLLKHPLDRRPLQLSDQQFQLIFLAKTHSDVSKE